MVQLVLLFIPVLLGAQLTVTEMGALPERVSNNAVCEGFIDDSGEVPAVNVSHVWPLHQAPGKKAILVAIGGVVLPPYEYPKVKSESTPAIVMDITVNGETKEAFVYGNRGLPGNPSTLIFDDISVGN